MHETVQFVVHYGYWLLFGWVLAEQGGLPVPALPLMMTAGALAGEGQLRFALIILVVVLGCFVSDSLWFAIGRRKGGSVLRLLCRIAMEPDHCVSRTRSTFGKFGPRTLLVSKFVPGLNTAAATLAATVGVSYGRFVLYDVIGAVLWSCTYVGVGFVFSKQLDRITSNFQRVGSWLVFMCITAVIAYMIYRVRARQLFLKQVRGDRITPEDLKDRLDAGEPVTIIDLRHPLDRLANPKTIPGALQIPPEELEARNNEITRDGEIVLFCT